MNMFILPDGYKLVYKVDLQHNKKFALIVNFSAIIIAVVMVIPAAFLHPLKIDFTGSMFKALVPFLAALPSMILYFVFHELVHGIFIRIYSGRRAHYGFSGLYAFAGSKAYFDKMSYIKIAIAPVVVWGIALFVLMFIVDDVWFWLVYMIQVINIAGAAGDYFVIYMIRKMPDDILIKDKGIIMDIYSRVHKSNIRSITSYRRFH